GDSQTADFTFYPHATIISGRFANSAQEQEVVKAYIVNEQLAERAETDLSDAVIDDLLQERLKTETFPCELKTISQVIREQEIDCVDLLKIDVEKSEHEVLAGIDQQDWAKIRQIVVEVHNIDGRLDQLTGLLTEKDYEIVVEPVKLVQDSDLYLVYATRPTSKAGPRHHVVGATDAAPLRQWTKSAGLIEDVRNYLQEKLPEYMTPAVFTFLDELPLSPNGKLDRKALPAPPQSRPKLDRQLVPPRSELEGRLAETWCRILKLDQIGIHDRFFELGGDSIQAAMFINSLQDSLNEFIYVVTIFENPTVADYAAFLDRDYGAAVAAWLGHGDRAVAPNRSDVGHAECVRRIDEAMLQRMHDCVPQLTAAPVAPDADEKNPPALFILAPPRSGTTLLRVMLAGHPSLLAAPELQLLCFNTLAERTRAFTGKFSAWAEGTIRAIMDLQQCDAEEAKEIMHSYEQEGYSTKDFYLVLQECIGDRILLDKTPSYALDTAVLEKAEQDFHDPLYIHLVRHPCAMIRSFQELHMEQVLYLKDHDFESRELGELVWTLSHRNIVDFLGGVPTSRQFRLSFEDLLRQPEQTMSALCQALGFLFHPDLLKPYENREKKMVDGIHEESTPMGDVNFLRHQQIQPELADRWKQFSEGDLLGDITWELATAFGYRRPAASDPKDKHWADRRLMARNRKEQQKQLRARRRRTPGC
ncbi:MAG: FkbM family methyltransferase, partial [Planctomycetota bacterium]|nr:FkbM family methyltransferase [Planctomycetota bacterium]